MTEKEIRADTEGRLDCVDVRVKVDDVDAVAVIDGVREEVGVGETLGEAPGERVAVGDAVLELVIDEVEDLVPLLDGVIEAVLVLVREFEGVRDFEPVTDGVFVLESLAVLDGVTDGVTVLDGDLEGVPDLEPDLEGVRDFVGVIVGVGVNCNRRGPSKCPPPLKLPSAISYDCVPVGVIVIVGDIVGGIVGDAVSC